VKIPFSPETGLMLIEERDYLFPGIDVQETIERG